MNQDLLATQQIISLFERSKALDDEILDDFPGVFLNLDAQGLILRANRTVSRLMDVEHEEILGQTLAKLFAGSDWVRFRNQLQVLAKNSATTLEFELPIHGGTPAMRDYLWQISRLKVGGLFTCVGNDISEAKSALAKVMTLAKDLELSKAVQDLLVPQTSDLKDDGYEAAAVCQPADVAGGDLWWTAQRDSKVWAFVGDVTGHGVGAAMVTALISGTLQTLFEEQTREVDMKRIFDGLNRRLLQLKGQPYWLSANAIELDLKAGQLNWWSAGAPAIMITEKDEVRALAEGGGLLGAGPTRLAEGKASFQPGQRLIIYTDGVTESSDSDEKQFGARRLRSFLKETRSRSVLQAREELLSRLNRWRGGARPLDDVTFILLDR